MKRIVVLACSAFFACGLFPSVGDLSSTDAATTVDGSSDAAKPIDATPADVADVTQMDVQMDAPAAGKIAFRAASTNANLGAAVSVQAPTGVAQNDFLWILLTVDDDTTSTSGVPSNWQLVSQLADTNDGFRAIAYTAFAQANEPNSYSFTLSKAIDWAIDISAYSGVRQQTPFDVSASFTKASSSPFVAPAVTTTVPNAVVLFGFAGESGNGGWVAPSTITTRIQTDYLMQGDLTMPTAGATSPQSVTYPNSGGMIVVAALAPE